MRTATCSTTQVWGWFLSSTGALAKLFILISLYTSPITLHLFLFPDLSSSIAFFLPYLSIFLSFLFAPSPPFLHNYYLFIFLSLFLHLCPLSLSVYLFIFTTLLSSFFPFSLSLHTFLPSLLPPSLIRFNMLCVLLGSSQILSQP